MIKREELIQTLNKVIGADLLSKAYVKDDMANGVQVAGADDVNKVAVGVSCNEEFLLSAVEWGAEFCIFHHGFDVRTDRSIYSKSSQTRLRTIFQNNLSVAGYHYALDAHKELGNNAQIIQKLGGQIVDTLFEEWGFVAELKSGITNNELRDKCSQLFNHEVLMIAEPDKQVKRIGVVSGSGKPYAAQLKEMHDKGVEAFITGESSESIPYKMKEEGISYFAGGHYATEVFGVQALGAELEKQLNGVVEVKFIDIPNSV